MGSGSGASAPLSKSPGGAAEAVRCGGKSSGLYLSVCPAPPGGVSSGHPYPAGHGGPL